MANDNILSMSDMRKKVKTVKKVKPKYPSLPKRDAQVKINKMAKVSGTVFWGGHTESRRDIRDFTLSDVVEILKEGIIREEPRLGAYGDWSYKVEAHRFRGGRSAAAVAIILDEENRLFVKTVMWMDFI